MNTFVHLQGAVCMALLLPVCVAVSRTSSISQH